MRLKDRANYTSLMLDKDINNRLTKLCVMMKIKKTEFMKTLVEVLEKKPSLFDFLERENMKDDVPAKGKLASFKDMKINNTITDTGNMIIVDSSTGNTYTLNEYVDKLVDEKLKKEIGKE